METTTILAFFSDSGTPALGLIPTINIREAQSGNIVVNGATCPEIGSGFYRYNFLYDPNLDYTVVVDGGNTLIDADRYVYDSVPNVTRLTGGSIA